MNRTKEANGDLCEMAMFCFLKGYSNLKDFPGLMKKIIETRAWECREFRGKVYKLPSLADLITRKPLEGWGESVDGVESLIKEDPETLAMFRAEITRAPHRPKKEERESNDNIITKAKQGTGKAYTLSRLSNENPDLYKQVCAGELTANAAAIAAGWRKKTVTVVDDPEKAAKALKKTFGEDWFRKMIQAAGLDPGKGKDRPAVKRNKPARRNQKESPKANTEKQPAKTSPKVVVNEYLSLLTLTGQQSWIMEDLKKDIQKNGIKEPLIVQQGTNILVDGYKRHKICQELKIPFQVQYDYFESMAEIAKQIVIDEAKALKKLKDETPPSPNDKDPFRFHVFSLNHYFRALGLEERDSIDISQEAARILGYME